jgi:radical SAM superfamily enzyme YgiQ (UPF0313 family)
MDVSVEPFDTERVRQARMVAISVPMHTALRLGTTVATRVREINSTCHICFFGLYATLNADYLLSHGADSVLGGELEEALVELVERLEGDTARSAVSRRESAPRLEKLGFVVPSRAKLPGLKQYAHIERDGRRELAGYVEASRGCKHLCRHCPIPPVYRGRFFVVPRDIVLGDVRQLVEAGAQHVTFGDPDFLNGPRHAMEVARAVHQEFPDLTFDFTAKVEHLLRQRALLAELAELGAIFVVSAVESLSDTVLAHLVKGHTRADVAAALDAVRAAGIAFRPTWVPFTPWTTLEDYREILGFIETENLVDHVDPVQYSIRLLVPPGSLLLDSPAMQPYLAPLVEDGFYYRWTHPDFRMDGLQGDVGRLVAAGADRREDAAITFARVCALADAAAGLTPSPAPTPLAVDRSRPPRLSEPWFC